MKPYVAEFPKHPLPHVPQPQAPQQTRVQPPIVCEKQQWEYLVLSRHLDQRARGEDELNALGSDGGNFVGVVPQPPQLQFFFKLPRVQGSGANVLFVSGARELQFRDRRMACDALQPSRLLYGLLRCATTVQASILARRHRSMTSVSHPPASAPPAPPDDLSRRSGRR